MKLLLLLSALGCMSGCVEKKRHEYAAQAIVIPLECITSDIVLRDCDATLTSCKRVNFKHRKGCEQIGLSK
jgi:hypothetical protein